MNNILNGFNFHIAAGFSHDTMLLYFFDLIQELTNERAYSYVSGSIPCKWNSGRIISNCTEKYMLQCFEQYALRNIPLYFTFSNYMLSERDVYDEQCNNILKIINDNHGGVIVGSDLLARYIKSIYPSIVVEASILRSVVDNIIHSADYYISLENLYDQIVFHPDDILCTEIIDNIVNKDKYEIIINEECVFRCGKRRDHDDLICKLYLGDGNITRDIVIDFENSFCPTKKADFIRKKKNAITIPEMEILAKKGYVNFKIQGRANSPMVLLYDMCNYIVNEKHRRTIFRNIASRFNFNGIKEDLRIWKVKF